MVQYRKDTRRYRLGLTLFILGGANFTAFWLVSLWLGGDALNGYQLDGRYFLASHGPVSEVSRGWFRFSEIHVFSQFVTMPLALVGGALMESVRMPKR